VKTSDFDYDLPPELIAQTPLEPRDASRLLILNRSTGTLEHTVFREIGRYLSPRDLLVLNQTRVIPARIYARKQTGGRVEVLLLRREDALTWECLVGGKGLLPGRTLTLEKGPAAEIVEALQGSRRRIRFLEPLEPYLPTIGHVPLPPYIHEPLTDPERYQTVYARQPGSAAAPTAGLHFTPRLLEELQTQGVGLAYVTLHVGLDTFAPVTEDDPAAHAIHTEWCELPPATAEAIAQTRRAGGRVIAVGTTSVRALESAGTRTADHGRRTVDLFPRRASTVSRLWSTVRAFTGSTSLFILPGYEFKIVDSLITNFHLPRSTLIMLVSAFAGREAVLRAYEIARQERYRFYSFGDAMLIL
jgi:S-adenosylmethionine:tRNA ribosyltransferase-isomerase